MVIILDILGGLRFSNVLRLAIGFRVSDGKMVIFRKIFGARS